MGNNIGAGDCAPPPVGEGGGYTKAGDQKSRLQGRRRGRGPGGNGEVGKTALPRPPSRAGVHSSGTRKSLVWSGGGEDRFQRVARGVGWAARLPATRREHLGATVGGAPSPHPFGRELQGGGGALPWQYSTCTVRMFVLYPPGGPPARLGPLMAGGLSCYVQYLNTHLSSRPIRGTDARGNLVTLVEGAYQRVWTAGRGTCLRRTVSSTTGPHLRGGKPDMCLRDQRGREGHRRRTF